jgi:hypothetical protein
MIGGSSKRRHEIVGERIRALYGHSVPSKLPRERAMPPAILFHSTSPNAADAITHDGLKPMSRQYVHLSVNRATALEFENRSQLFHLRAEPGRASQHTVCSSWPRHESKRSSLQVRRCYRGPRGVDEIAATLDANMSHDAPR